jgi:hypothetical protein
VRNLLVKIKVVVLLLLWLQMLVPAGLIHSFCDHHDTEHPHFPYGLTVSEQHHHCLVLELSLPSVTHSVQEWKLTPVVNAAAGYFSFDAFPCMAEKFIAGNRGPPFLFTAV